MVEGTPHILGDPGQGPELVRPGLDDIAAAGGMPPPDAVTGGAADLGYQERLRDSGLYEVGMPGHTPQAPDENMTAEQVSATDDNIMDRIAQETPKTDTILGTLDEPDDLNTDNAFGHPIHTEFSNSNGSGSEFGLKYGRTGDVMAWSENEHTSGQDREIIIHAAKPGQEKDDHSYEHGREVTWLIRGNIIYEIEQSAPGQGTSREPSIMKVQQLAPGESLADVVIGQDMGEGKDDDHRDKGLILQSVQVRIKKEGYHIPTGAKYVESEASIQGNRDPRGLEIPKEKVKADGDIEYIWQNRPNGIGELKRKPNPFLKMRALIGKEANGELSPDEDVKLFGQMFDWESKITQPPEPEMEAAYAAGKLEEYTQLFEDETFVPSPSQYEEMRRVAVRLSFPDGTPRPFVGAVDLDQDVLRAFFANVELGRWQLTDFQREVYSKGLSISPLNVHHNAHFRTGNLDDILTLPEFLRIRHQQLREETYDRLEAARQEGNPNPVVSTANALSLGKEYLQYVARRIELADAIKDIPEAERFERVMQQPHNQGSGEDPTEVREVFDWQDEEPTLVQDPDEAAGAQGDDDLEIPHFVNTGEPPTEETPETTAAAQNRTVEDIDSGRIPSQLREVYPNLQWQGLKNLDGLLHTILRTHGVGFQVVPTVEPSPVEAAVRNEFAQIRTQRGSKKAIRELARKYHPDQNPGSEEQMKVVSTLITERNEAEKKASRQRGSSEPA